MALDDGNKLKPQVVACENGIFERDSFESTLVHELVMNNECAD